MMKVEINKITRDGPQPRPYFNDNGSVNVIEDNTPQTVELPNIIPEPQPQPEQTDIFNEDSFNEVLRECEEPRAVICEPKKKNKLFDGTGGNNGDFNINPVYVFMGLGLLKFVL